MIFYTVGEVADVLDLTKQTILNYISNGNLPAVKVGKSYRIYKKDFTDFINKNSTSAKDEIINSSKPIYKNIKLGNYQLNEVSKSYSSNNRLFVYGDNLIVLQKLLKKYKNKVDLIYIDPPFGTGQTFSDLENNLAYKDTLTDEGFLNFLKVRLELLKKFLSKKGSIYLHIDKKVGHYVKVVMDEVFGYDNFINDISRIKCNPKNFKRKAYGNYSDMILYYAKNRDNQIWNEVREPLSQIDIERLFPKTDKNGNRYTTHPIHAPGVTNNGDTGKPWKGMEPPKGRHWRYSREVLTKLDDDGLIEWSSNGNPRKIVYASDHKGKKVQDVWEFKDKGKSYVDYPTQKNTELLERIILNSSNEDSIVMDCFAGSGTTLLAANKHNRKWIGIDNSELAFDVIKDKLEQENISAKIFTIVKEDFEDTPQVEVQ